MSFFLSAPSKGMSVQPLQEHKTKAQQVYEGLRESICTGELLPGTRLVIHNIADQMGVSDIPVREAIQRLKLEGLVDAIPYTGAVVAPLVPDRVRQSLEARSVLEAFACRHAVPFLTSSDLETLVTLIEEMDACIERGEMREYSRVNRKFHLTIIERCPNVCVQQLLRGLMVESDRARAIFVTNPEMAVTSNQEHRFLLNAFRDGDVDTAEAIMRVHQMRVAREFASLDERPTEDTAPRDVKSAMEKGDDAGQL